MRGPRRRARGGKGPPEGGRADPRDERERRRDEIGQLPGGCPSRGAERVAAAAAPGRLRRRAVQEPGSGGTMGGRPAGSGCFAGDIVSLSRTRIASAMGGWSPCAGSGLQDARRGSSAVPRGRGSLSRVLLGPMLGAPWRFPEPTRCRRWGLWHPASPAATLGLQPRGDALVAVWVRREAEPDELASPKRTWLIYFLGIFRGHLIHAPMFMVKHVYYEFCNKDTCA